MTTRPKRAFLSLKSMMVLSAALSGFTVANISNRVDGLYIRRGLPLPYAAWAVGAVDPEFAESLLSESGSKAFPELDRPDRRGVGVPASRGSAYNFLNLAVDVAFALIVSVLLALASERFVFSRMRRGSAPSGELHGPPRRTRERDFIGVNSENRTASGPQRSSPHAEGVALCFALLSAFGFVLLEIARRHTARTDQSGSSAPDNIRWVSEHVGEIILFNLPALGSIPILIAAIVASRRNMVRRPMILLSILLLAPFWWQCCLLVASLYQAFSESP